MVVYSMYQAVYNKQRGRRKGMSVIEATIALICIGVILAAIMQTAGWSSRMSSRGQQNLDIYAFANSWFNTLQAAPSSLVNTTNPTAAMNWVAQVLGSTRSMDIGGYHIVSTFTPATTARGVVSVRATFSSGGTDPVTITRDIYVNP